VAFSGLCLRLAALVSLHAYVRGGAGDNALRGLSFMAVSLSRAGFTTYAVTFAHNQGDNFQQAEQVSHVVALALEETGAQRADVVLNQNVGFDASRYADVARGTRLTVDRP
jgi:hypothetical protein